MSFTGGNANSVTAVLHALRRISTDSAVFDGTRSGGIQPEFLMSYRDSQLVMVIRSANGMFSFARSPFGDVPRTWRFKARP
jgi:hypothetical protein